MDLLREYEKQQTTNLDRPSLRAGDIVRVQTKVKEGDKTRIQAFEGVVLGTRGSGPSKTFTVRRETGRFAVERIFPLYSPLITAIEITRRQKVRRAKLNYLRNQGRRRVKEDLVNMQRHEDELAEKKRLAEQAAKREAEKEAAKKAAEAKAKKAEQEKKSEEQADKSE